MNQKLRQSVMTVAAAVATLAVSASAQSAQLERMRIASDSAGVVSAEGGTVQPHLRWAISTWTSWSQNPLVAYRLTDGARVASLVKNRTGLSLGGTLGLFDRAQISFELPSVVYQNNQLGNAAANATLPALASSGLGNLWLTPKLKLLSGSVDAALLAGVAIPLGGSADAFTADSSVAFRPELALSTSLGDFRVAANAGALLRRTTEILDLRVGSEVFGQFGVGYRVPGPSLERPVDLGMAIAGSFSATRPFERAAESSVELRASAAYAFSEVCSIFVGGGRGLTSGWGTPDWRVFGGLRITSPGEEKRPEPIRPSFTPLLVARRSSAPVLTQNAPEIVEPAPVPPLQVEDNKLVFSGEIRFIHGHHDLRQDSLTVLNQIAQMLRDHPEVELVHVQGHSDKTGDREDNLRLSERRARIVVDYLVRAGISPERFTVRGFGPDRPRTSNATAVGRWRNRRVEFHILSRRSASAASASVMR